MHELRHEFCLAPLLRAAKLARSTFYYQLNVAKSPDRNHDLKAKIQSVYLRIAACMVIGALLWLSAMMARSLIIRKCNGL